MTAVATDAQDIYVRNVLTRLREDADLSTLRSHEAELAARRDALSAAVEKRRQLAVPDTDANRRLSLEQAKRLYNHTEAQLRLLLEDKALVESYFLPLTRSAASAEDGTVEE